MKLHSNAGGHTSAPAASPSATSSRPHTGAGRLPSLLHLLPSLPIELQLNITRRLYPLDLQDLTLACQAARDIVYSIHVTKLTFTKTNMRKPPTHATMSAHYPAVSHIVIQLTKGESVSSERQIHRVSKCLHSLLLQNSEQTMRGITHLDLTLTDSAACRSAVMAGLADLLRLCTSLKRLEVRWALNQVGGDRASTMHLVLCEQAPGQHLQHHGDLLDRCLAGGLKYILSSAACIAELSQLSVLPQDANIPSFTFLCDALPQLSALRGLTMNLIQPGDRLRSPTPQQMENLTRLDITLTLSSAYNIGPAYGHGHHAYSPPDPADLDLPALQDLTLCCHGHSGASRSVSFSSSMQSLTRLNLSHVRLQPASNLKELQSLRHLRLKYCVIDTAASVSLASDIQALPGLTQLEMVGFQCEDCKQDVADSLHLEAATQLSQLCVTNQGHDIIHHIPPCLTSLTLCVDPSGRRLRKDSTVVGLPLTWQALTQLERLSFTFNVDCADWGQALAMVAQLTTLSHLEVGDPRGRWWGKAQPGGNLVDPSCLDSLTRLTCLKVQIYSVTLDTPQWPRLVKAARLQHVHVARCSAWEELPLPASLLEIAIESEAAVHLPRALPSCVLLQSLSVDTESKTDAIHGVASLSSLQLLQSLALRGKHHGVSEPELDTIAQLHNLQVLSLGDIRSGSLRRVGALKQLTRLELGTRDKPMLTRKLEDLQDRGWFPRLESVDSSWRCY